jgi:hypothetical protein
MREEIIELLNRDPFVPFTIVTTGGREYVVANPNLVALGQSLLHVFFPRSDRSATLRIAEVVSLEFGDAPRPRRKSA